MEKQDEEPQMKQLCNTRTVIELFADCFKSSKRGGGGEKSKPAALLASAGRNS